MEMTTITLPLYWASALIEGDYSGLTSDSGEASRCRCVVQKLARDGWIIACTVEDEDPRFTWHYQLFDPGSGKRGGEVLDYVMFRYKNVPL